MIIIEELQVTKDAKNLIIGARVRKDRYYTDVYIDKIIIDTEETYVEGGPSKSPIYSKQLEGNNKEVNLSLDKLDLGVHPYNHLFFVYITVKGTPSSDTPCGMDNVNTLGVTMYSGDYYKTFMSYIKEMNNTCQVPQGLIDTILRYKALNASIDSGHYIQGIKYFNKWFSGKTTLPITSNCGCNG